ncbi:hypothetical protein PsorP6_000932 [Peronosclerospora sorghi]|uniref:Uncharacterized protein n=1 Tax=Peronosclerospora sorghi TaxID=230839 RepID=A0ACC0WUA5_9STRA|nr:hypothetical protein PsorP6_000932 [Peronosclerospora sorghi]
MLNPTIIREIVHLHRSGTPPKDIVDPINRRNVMINAIGVRNLVAKAQRKKLAGLTPMEALMKQLKEKEVVSTGRIDETTNTVLDMFFQTDSAEKLTKDFGDVLLIDATYKTNKYNMPLVHVVGIASTYESFSSLFALI